MTARGTTDYSDTRDWNCAAQERVCDAEVELCAQHRRTKKGDADADSKFRSEFAIANSRRRLTRRNGGNSTAALMQRNDPLSQLQNAATCCSVYVRAAPRLLDRTTLQPKCRDGSLQSATPAHRTRWFKIDNFDQEKVFRFGPLRQWPPSRIFYPF